MVDLLEPLAQRRACQRLSGRGGAPSRRVSRRRAGAAQETRGRRAARTRPAPEGPWHGCRIATCSSRNQLHL